MARIKNNLSAEENALFTGIIGQKYNPKQTFPYNINTIPLCKSEADSLALGKQKIANMLAISESELAQNGVEISTKYFVGTDNSLSHNMVLHNDSGTGYSSGYQTRLTINNHEEFTQALQTAATTHNPSAQQNPENTRLKGSCEPDVPRKS